MKNYQACTRPGCDGEHAPKEERPPTTIKITLEGARGAGKSLLLGEFTRFLERHGCRVERLPDGDVGLPAESARIVVPAGFARALHDRRRQARLDRQGGAA